MRKRTSIRSSSSRCGSNNLPRDNDFTDYYKLIMSNSEFDCSQEILKLFLSLINSKVLVCFINKFNRRLH